jgi:predicted DNA-binding transcriptional regulator AlpA
MDTILFSGINPQDFKKEILEAISNELQKIQNSHKEDRPSDLLTRQQTADFLSIDLSTLHHWTKKGKLPSYGIGHRVYYKLSDIEQAIVKLS